ncbi:hypothetical protein HDU82_006813, partial [Entophlyctis luteolus]
MLSASTRNHASSAAPRTAASSSLAALRDALTTASRASEGAVHADADSVDILIAPAAVCALDIDSSHLNSFAPPRLLFWSIHAAIAHPLRAFLGPDASLILVSLASGEDCPLRLRRIPRIFASSSSTASRGLPDRACMLPCSILLDDPPNFTCEFPVHTLAPVPIDICRHLLFLCNQIPDSSSSSSRFSSKPLLPVFALCASSSKSEVDCPMSYLGIQIPHAAAQTFPRIFSVHSCGIMRSGEEIPISAERIVEDFLREADCGDFSPATQACAVWRLLEPANAHSATIDFEVTWDSVQKLLSKPVFSTSITLKVRYVPGSLDPENHEASARLRGELLAVQSLFDISLRQHAGQAGAKYARWRLTEEVDQSVEDHGDKRDICSSLDAFLEDIRMNQFGCASHENEDPSILEVLPERDDLDFTDRLFLFCTATKSIDDLIAATTKIANALRLGDIQPMVAKNNPTRIANVVRDCLKVQRTQAASDFQLRQAAVTAGVDNWLRNIVEWLVEAGIYKLQRDY